MICATEADHGPGCDRTSRCTVNLLWLRIRDAIAGTLDSITLADLVPQKPIAAEALAARDRNRALEPTTV
jgi:DNA-binding IscR family transcriptional regulator